MKTTRANAVQFVQLLELMRAGRPSPAFKQISALNLSFSHLRTLHMLAQAETLAMKDLAERLDMTPPSVTALTRRLVQTGLVQRQSDPGDNRVVLLSLTDEGRRLGSALYDEQVSRMERLLAALAPEEQELFLNLLERAVRAMHVAQLDDPAAAEQAAAAAKE